MMILFLRNGVASGLNGNIFFSFDSKGASFLGQIQQKKAKGGACKNIKIRKHWLILWNGERIGILPLLEACYIPKYQETRQFAYKRWLGMNQTFLGIGFQGIRRFIYGIGMIPF